MSIALVEEAGSRESVIQRIGKREKSKVDVKFKCLGADTDDQVHVICNQFFSSNRFYRVLGYVFLVENYQIAHLGGDAWDVIAHYESMGFDEDREPMKRARSFQTGGTTARMMQAYAERRYPPDAPDMKKAIDVDGDAVKGVEVTVPGLTWTENYDVPSAVVTWAYVKFLASAKGAVNKKAFRTFAPGEVCFDGCEGAQQWDEERGDGPMSLNFKFTAEPNAGVNQTLEPLTIGDITGIEKKGHEYLWTRYETVVVDGIKVQKPAAVYVNEVKRIIDFADFGIGVD